MEKFTPKRRILRIWILGKLEHHRTHSETSRNHPEWLGSWKMFFRSLLLQWLKYPTPDIDKTIDSIKKAKYWMTNRIFPLIQRYIELMRNHEADTSDRISLQFTFHDLSHSGWFLAVSESALQCHNYPNIQILRILLLGVNFSTKSAVNLSNRFFDLKI